MKHRAVVFVSLCLALVGFAGTPTLIPLPQLQQNRSGVFTLCPTLPIIGAPAQATTKIYVDTNSYNEGQYLAALLLKSTGHKFQVVTNNSAGPIPNSILLTTVNGNANLGTEGYELTIAPDSVVSRSIGSAGVFYGIQSLLQMAPPQILSPTVVTNVQWTIPCVFIQDAPRYPWRGWMLDPVRHFFTVDEVKQMIDALAYHKENMLHIHLDDDAGWRFEVLKYPLLTAWGAWRNGLNFGINPKASQTYGPDGRYGGYYTQDDCRDMVAYAAQRHITIIPEIEMPGHSGALVTAVYTNYPSLHVECDCSACSNAPFNLDVTNSVGGRGGIFCPARPDTFTFLHDILDEVMNVFPSPVIHIGGDEVLFNNWTNHSLDMAMTNSLGLTNGGGSSVLQKYQAWFTQQIADYIHNKGRTMMGWSEIMNGGLITNCILDDWLATKSPLAASNHQGTVISSSAIYYINKYEHPLNQNIWSNEPPGQAGDVPLSAVYNSDPASNVVTLYTNYVLGIETPNWSEFIPCLMNLQFKAFPRLCAAAEVGWTPLPLRNFSDFTNRLELHKQRLRAAAINYNTSITPPVIGSWSSNQITTTFSTLEWDVTTNVTSAGEFDVSFCWKAGTTNGLLLQWAALIENGVEIDRDTHQGWSGYVSTTTSSATNAVYIMRLPALRPSATYKLRASVLGTNGINSYGLLYKPNWD